MPIATANSIRLPDRVRAAAGGRQDFESSIYKFVVVATLRSFAPQYDLPVGLRAASERRSMRKRKPDSSARPAARASTKLVVSGRWPPRRSFCAVMSSSVLLTDRALQSARGCREPGRRGSTSGVCWHLKPFGRCIFRPPYSQALVHIAPAASPPGVDSRRKASCRGCRVDVVGPGSGRDGRL